MRITIVLAVAIALGPRPARGDDRRELRPAARARFDAGVQLTSAGKYDDAIREFRAAYDLDPDPVLFYSLAVAERLAGRCPAAIDYYQRFLRSKPNPRRTEAARAGIAMCEHQGAPACPPPRVVRDVRDDAPWYRSPAAGAIAGGVVGIAAGAGFLIAARSTADRAAAARFSDDFEATLDRATGQRRTGAVLAVLGAALAGGGVAYHVAVQRKRRPQVAIGIGARSLFLARSF
jgi:tetratricopeptide (TPR) repeat protein